jgi:hypothetical protein
MLPGLSPTASGIIESPRVETSQAIYYKGLSQFDFRLLVADLASGRDRSRYEHEIWEPIEGETHPIYV